MEVVLLLVAVVFSLVSLVCNIIILVDAFKSSVGEGFMCLCVPCYILYYMFAKFEHPQKALIIAGSIGGSVVSNVVQVASGGFGGGYNSGYGY